MPAFRPRNRPNGLFTTIKLVNLEAIPEGEKRTLSPVAPLPW
jgi:hypothetical protein